MNWIVACVEACGAKDSVKVTVHGSEVESLTVTLPPEGVPTAQFVEVEEADAVYESVPKPE